MLRSVSIRDLAVVEHLELDFGLGLTVLTGETGAGKSMLLTALGLALGDRADPGCIRAGAARAEVIVVFALEDAPLARDWLMEQALDHEEDCLIRRVVSQDGRSKAYVNGSQVTLQSLQALGQTLLEIHGQHAHVRLLRAQEQRRLLDEAAANRDCLEQMAVLAESLRALQLQYERLDAGAVERIQRLRDLEHSIEEMEAAEVGQLQYEALIESHSRQANTARILEVGQRELALLFDGDERAVASLLAQSVRGLSELANWGAGYREASDLLAECQLNLKEACQILRRELDRVDADPAHLEAIEARLATIHRLARKHQVRPEALQGLLDAQKAELAALVAIEEDPAALLDALESLRRRCQGQAHELTERRQRAAKTLEARIEGLAKALGLTQIRFEWAVEPASEALPGALGWDRVEIRLSANPGMPLGSLSKVASGGELSRISLAIQVALTGIKSVPTLIFDEVDSGIGGRIGAVVGAQLRHLGETHQVFSVTHLPQVAVQGHHHLRVEKAIQEGVTRTQVRSLCAGERREEIARMLGGDLLTEAALAHAAEMLAGVERDAP